MRPRLIALVPLLAACASTPPPSSPAPPPVRVEVQVAPAPAPAPLTRIALIHVTVVDPSSGTEQADRAVIFDGDRIVSVVAANAVPASPPTRAVDATGKYLIPGLWDMHVHFADPASPKLFVANGVTSVRVMWGNPRFAPGMERFHFDMRDAFDKQVKLGPRMVIASNILDGPKPTWPNSASLSTPEEGRKAVDDAKASGVDFIKVYTGLPKPVFLAIADESKKQGLPFAGHVPDSVSVEEASDAGQKSIEHMTGMLFACSAHGDALRKKAAEFAAKDHKPDERAKFQRALRDEAIATYDPKRAGVLFAKLVANGTWQTPTLTVLRAMSTLDDPAHASDPRLAYVSTFMRARWDPKADFRTKDRTPADYVALRATVEKQTAILGAMNKGGVPILAGTDELNPYCFAGFSLHDELGLLVKAGLTPAEALRAATSGPAKYFGWESKMGAVADGKVADLVLLDADPLADIANTQKISGVVSRGTFYDRAALDQMLEDVKHTAGHPALPRGGFDPEAW